MEAGITSLGDFSACDVSELCRRRVKELVRREKAATSSGSESHPATGRSSR
jgi:hypothetical protein